MQNQAILMGIRIVVVNRTTGREWATNLNAEGVLCAMKEEVKRGNVNKHVGGCTVMVEGKPMPVEYAVDYTHYDAGMSVTTKVVAPDDNQEKPKWLVKLIPQFDIVWQETYPIGI